MRPGDVIARRYRLERLLGSGGMGAVWAATHAVTGKSVALKLLRPKDNDKVARKRVLREARAACAVQHPNVAAVHDVIEADDGSPVLVMDLLEGESLGARLGRERTLPVDEVLRIADAVLDVLEVAHAAGIIHRDLKPDNLFVLKSGQIVLLDFGVAKLLGSDRLTGTTGTLTASDAMVGTPHYMAPEQAFGEPIDGRTDLWAVGVVMYECLTGEVPTRGENLGQVLRRLSLGTIEPVRARAPDVPAAVAAVVDALLSVDPGARPLSARVARVALKEAGELVGGVANDGDGRYRSRVSVAISATTSTEDGSGIGDGSGSGYGDGSGYGSGYGDGSGYGSGYGDGSGYGSGSGSGSGSGNGDGSGSGDRSGSGNGNGDLNGNGNGYWSGEIKPLAVNLAYRAPKLGRRRRATALVLGTLCVAGAWFAMRAIRPTPASPGGLAAALSVTVAEGVSFTPIAFPEALVPPSGAKAEAASIEAPPAHAATPAGANTSARTGRSTKADAAPAERSASTPDGTGAGAATPSATATAAPTSATKLLTAVPF